MLVELKHEVIWFAVATKQIEIIQHAKIEGESILKEKLFNIISFPMQGCWSQFNAIDRENIS